MKIYSTISLVDYHKFNVILLRPLTPHVISRIMGIHKEDEKQDNMKVRNRRKRQAVASPNAIYIIRCMKRTDCDEHKKRCK